MKPGTILWIFVTVILLQLLWYGSLPPGNRFASGSPEMIEKRLAYKAHPSSETEAAMYGQIKTDELRESGRKNAIFAWMLVADAMAVALYAVYDRKRLPFFRTSL